MLSITRPRSIPGESASRWPYQVERHQTLLRAQVRTLWPVKKQLIRHLIVKLHWSLRVSFLILPPQQLHTQGASSEGAYRPQGKQSRSASPSISAHPLSASHGKSKSLAFNPSSPSTPIPVETGSHHLLPVPPISAEQQYTAYRAVPDLAFLPTLFQSPEAQALSQQHGQIGSPSIGSSGKLDEAVVLMPTKIETVEIAIPLRVYPSATPFRSPMSTFRV
jgi:hypothetical protein